MLCKNCGKEIPEGSKFCIECGAKVESEEQANVAEEAAVSLDKTAETAPEQPVTEKEAVQPAQQPSSTPAQQSATAPAAAQPDKPKKKMNIGLLVGLIVGGVILLIVIITIIIVLVLNHKEKVDIAQFFKVTYEGTDGYGYATVDFDEDAYIAELTDKSSAYEKIADDSSSTVPAKKRLAYTTLTYSLDYELDKTEDLSNGDTVKLTINYDNDAANTLGIEFVEESSTEFKVEGLTEVKEVDPFEGIEVTFTGTAPEGTASIDITGSDDYYSGLDTEIDKDSYSLSNGDVVTVTLEYWGDEDTFTETYGVKLTSLSKEYTVSGLDEYVSSIDGIGEDALSGMKTTTEDDLKSYFADEDDYIGYSDLTYQGMYLLCAKNSSSWEHNKVIIVYKATVSSKDKSFKNTTVYYPVTFEDVITYADGTQNYEESYFSTYTLPEETGLEYDNGWDEVRGYKDLKKLKTDYVDSESSSFTSEASEGLE